MCLAIVDRYPVRVKLRDTIRRSRIERRRLTLRGLDDLSKHFRRRRLVESNLLKHTEDSKRLEKTERSHCIRIRRELRRVEGNLNVTLRAEVVDLVGLGFLNNANEVRRICEIAVMHRESRVDGLRLRIDAVHTLGIE